MSAVERWGGARVVGKTEGGGKWGADRDPIEAVLSAA